MPKPQIYVYHPVDETGASYRRMAERGIDVVKTDRSWSAIANSTGGAEIMFEPETVAGVGAGVRSWPVTRASLASAPNLRLIANYTVGYDNVDLDAATDLGVLVVHSPTESNWGGVAEGTLAYLLALLKKVRERDRHVKAAGWRDPALKGTYLGARQSDGYGGICIGIVGLGRIGSRVADLLGPWRVRLIGCDPYVDEAKFAIHGVAPVDLETLLAGSDVVTIHCNLTAETTNLIGRDALAAMKPAAILVNTARGAVVDADALFDALDRDEIAGAALDVLPEEPPDPQAALLGLGDKVLLSPHMIAANRGTGLQMAVPWVEEAIYAALRGAVPRHVVNEAATPKWRARFGGKSLL